MRCYVSGLSHPHTTSFAYTLSFSFLVSSVFYCLIVLPFLVFFLTALVFCFYCFVYFLLVYGFLFVFVFFFCHLHTDTQLPLTCTYLLSTFTFFTSLHPVSLLNIVSFSHLAFFFSNLVKGGEGNTGHGTSVYS